MTKKNPATVTVHVSIPTQVYAQLKQQIEDGRYISISEAIREALSLLRMRKVYLNGYSQEGELV